MPKRDSQSSSIPHTSASGHRSKWRSPSDRQDAGTGSRASAASASSSPTSSSVQPNFDSSDPYVILGVTRDATFQHVKMSYRKLALKHHPDRQTSESDKKMAHKNFASIGNAYEILGDEGRRREYDEGLQQQHQQQRQQRREQQHGSRRNNVGRDPFSMFNDPFFSNSFGGQSQRSSRSAFHFTDPFDLFNQFFAEEMGRHSQHHNSRTSGMTDQFSSDPFFSSGAPFSDPFFSSGGMGMGGGMKQMMSGHANMMNSMMSQMHSGSMFGGFNDQHQQLMRNNGNSGGSSYNFASSSSSSSNRGGQQSSSTSTRTTIVNGVRKTIKETTVVHPDGTMDQHVETIEGGGNDMGRLSSANDYYGSRRSGHR
mmetsp:Transcript_14751/g.32045  ORF Transcript_14751/g.32045 Transcript_14751/m.32045 type:complete len:368 (+) Transcript_14751:124-1227(+)